MFWYTSNKVLSDNVMCVCISILLTALLMLYFIGGASTHARAQPQSGHQIEIRDIATFCIQLFIVTKPPKNCVGFETGNYEI